jgi:hypothetical protein
VVTSWRSTIGRGRFGSWIARSPGSRLCAHAPVCHGDFGYCGGYFRVGGPVNTGSERY